MTTKQSTKKKTAKKTAAMRTGGARTKKKTSRKPVSTGKRAASRSASMQSASSQGRGGTEPKATASAHATKRKATRPKRTSLLDAAAQVLAGAQEPMSCRQIVDEILRRKLWTTRGKTPHQTLHAAMIREIQKQGKKTRFKKTGRGRFSEKDCIERARRTQLRREE